jgi:hypothetical protein
MNDGNCCREIILEIKSRMATGLNSMRWIRSAVVAGIVFLFGVSSCVDLPSESHDRAFSEEGLIRADAASLRATVVSPHLDAVLPRDENVLWCGTFQLAWNEVCGLAGGKLQFRDKAPDGVEVLNRKTFERGNLDDASFVALAGYVRDGIVERIGRALQEKFNGQASPVLASFPAVTRPQDMVVYAYLFKNLEFPVPYERGQTPVKFDGKSVACFGMGPEYKPGREPMAQQTLINDYVSRDDFVVELKTKSEGDRLNLAKVKPARTLAETVAAVAKRTTGAGAVTAEPADVLVVPKLNFDVTRRYAELEGLHLVPTATGMAEDLTLLRALQNVRFQMDEKGVRLRSEAHMSFGCSAAYSPPPKHEMIFDKPFLIMMVRKGATQPYFAFWVANPELLVKAE